MIQFETTLGPCFLDVEIDHHQLSIYMGKNIQGWTMVLMMGDGF
jgi:hypothetical protein